MTLRTVLALAFALTLGCDFGIGSAWGDAFGGGGWGGGGGGGGGSSSSLITLDVETLAFTTDVGDVHLGLDDLDRTEAWVDADWTGEHTMFVWQGRCAEGVAPNRVWLGVWNLEGRVDAPPDPDLVSEIFVFGALCSERPDAADAEPTVTITSDGFARRVVIDAEDAEGSSFHAELVYTLECGLPGLACCPGRTCFGGARCGSGMCPVRSSDLTDAGSSDAGVADGGVDDAGS